jgi:phosphatidate cytidylyltransferase
MKTRILTATVLIVGVLWIVFFAPGMVFDVFLILFLGLAAWEWAGLIPGKFAHVPWGRSLFVIFVEVLLAISFIFLPTSFQNLFYVNGVLLLIMIHAVLTYPKTTAYWHSSLVVTVLGLSFLVIAIMSIVYLKQMPQGNIWLLSVLLLTWAMDTGAYFAGRFWGKRKLLPLVSPNKTWEGFLGGFVLSELVVIIFGIEFATQTVGFGYWMFMGTLAILGAVFGDLFISMLKRGAGVKDTGSLLPGHGGILDRVDSLLISAFVLAFFMMVGR